MLLTHTEFSELSLIFFKQMLYFISRNEYNLYTSFKWIKNSQKRTIKKLDAFNVISIVITFCIHSLVTVLICCIVNQLCIYLTYTIKFKYVNQLKSNIIYNNFYIFIMNTWHLSSKRIFVTLDLFKVVYLGRCRNIFKKNVLLII